MKIIGLTGYAGAGKNEAANGLYGWKQIAFGDALRREVRAFCRNKQIPLSQIPLQFHTACPADITKPYSKLGRELLQWWGTEFRRSQDPAYWVKLCGYQMFTHWDDDAVNYWVITDVRFPNEVQFIRALGGVIVHIGRKGNERPNDHISETLIDEIHPDFAIWNDGDIPALHRKIQEIAAAL